MEGYRIRLWLKRGIFFGCILITIGLAFYLGFVTYSSWTEAHAGTLAASFTMMGLIFVFVGWSVSLRNNKAVIRIQTRDKILDSLEDELLRLREGVSPCRRVSFEKGGKNGGMLDPFEALVRRSRRVLGVGRALMSATGFRTRQADNQKLLKDIWQEAIVIFRDRAALLSVPLSSTNAYMDKLGSDDPLQMARVFITRGRVMDTHDPVYMYRQQLAHIQKQLQQLGDFVLDEKDPKALIATLDSKFSPKKEETSVNEIYLKVKRALTDIVDIPKPEDVEMYEQGMETTKQASKEQKIAYGTPAISAFDDLFLAFKQSVKDSKLGKDVQDAIAVLPQNPNDYILYEGKYQKAQSCLLPILHKHIGRIADDGSQRLFQSIEQFYQGLLYVDYLIKRLYGWLETLDEENIPVGSDIVGRDIERQELDTVIAMINWLRDGIYNLKRLNAL